MRRLIRLFAQMGMLFLAPKVDIPPLLPQPFLGARGKKRTWEHGIFRR